ncbi:MAG: redoxin domain-containing protein [Actinobacteria bacterium]|nr:redoxin domain-containing protein [Actinomycetota bacterium]
MKVLHYRQRIDALGTVLFVAFDEPDRLQRTLLRGLKLPYPLLVDPERSAYRAWGLGRGSVVRVWGDPRVWLRYAAEIARGERLRRPRTDTLQLGGDFVVDPEGTVVYSRPQRRDDRPPVAALLQALEHAAGESAARGRASKDA